VKAVVVGKPGGLEQLAVADLPDLDKASEMQARIESRQPSGKLLLCLSAIS
jgi:hypothetical protein